MSYFYTSAQRRGVFLLLFLLSLLVIYRFTKDAIVGSNSISVIEIQHLKASILNNDLQQFKSQNTFLKIEILIIGIVLIGSQ